MTLKLASADPKERAAAAAPTNLGPRVLAPGAPESPGTLPLELAEHVQHGEAVIWWNEKNRVDLRGAAGMLGIMAVVLLLVTFLAPEFWSQPLASLWPPLAALLSPIALLLLREVANRRALVVTDNALIDMSARGHVDRLSFGNVRRVRRHLIFGGLRLDGVAHRVRIVPSMIEDARRAIETQRTGQWKGVANQVDDPMGWLP